MINLHKTFLESVLIFFLFTNSTIFAQGDGNGSGKIDDEFFFDVDAVKFEKTRLLRPEFHGNISVGAPFSEGLDESEKDSSNVFKQTEVTLWSGVQIFKNLSFVTELEIEEGFEEFVIERFALDWNIFNDRCIFRIGKFYYPFGIERLVENPVNNKLIDRPSPSVKIIPGTYSDEGIEIYGNVPFLYKTRLKYEFAVTSGLSSYEGKGEQHLDDNNDNFSLGGRLGIELLPGLEIGGSYSTGKYDDDEKFRMDFIGADASDATEDGGKIRISTCRSDDGAQIKLEDSGCGIASENLEKVFEPFFSTKSPGKGTGLGLSICYGIIEEHKGKILVSSDGVGKGATFTIILPADAKVQS